MAALRSLMLVERRPTKFEDPGHEPLVGSAVGGHDDRAGAVPPTDDVAERMREKGFADTVVHGGVEWLTQRRRQERPSTACLWLVVLITCLPICSAAQERDQDRDQSSFVGDVITVSGFPHGHAIEF